MVAVEIASSVCGLYTPPPAKMPVLLIVGIIAATIIAITAANQRLVFTTADGDAPLAHRHGEFGRELHRQPTRAAQPSSRRLGPLVATGTSRHLAFEGAGQ